MLDSITVIGKGKAGQSLAKAIRQSGGFKLSAILPARSARFKTIDSEVVIIAAKDDVIDDVSRKVISTASVKLKLMIHLAGSRPSSVLAPRSGVMRMTLHPIQTFSKPSADLFRGIYWMASSEDAAAIQWARRFVASLGGGGVIVLPAESLPLYHALTVFSSNFVTLLGGAIEEMSEELGQNPKMMKAAIRPLMEQAVKNVLAKPAKDVLTGPIQRGDIETIRKHRKALKELDPKLRKLYDAFVEFASVKPALKTDN